MISKQFRYVLFFVRAGDHYPAYMTKQINVVYYDGRVNWAAPIIIKSHCTIDVTSFPFDGQACELKFGPWQYNGNEVTLHGEGTTFSLSLFRLFTHDMTDQGSRVRGQMDMLHCCSFFTLYTQVVFCYPMSETNSK